MTDGAAEATSNEPDKQAGGTGVEPAGEFGMFVFLASEGLLFGGLILTYVIARMQRGAEFTAGSVELSLPLGTINTVVLLTSSFLVALATIWGEQKKFERARRALLGTAGLGLVFLAIKATEWFDEGRKGLLPIGNADFRYPSSGIPENRLFFDIYLALTGTHAVHLVTGVSLVLFLAISWKRLEKPDHALRLIALYWHFIDVVWVFLFPLLYLVR